MSVNSLKKSFLILAAAVICLLPTAASAAMPSAGDLIKLPDDGKAETTADSAVYYYGADGKRYVFTNSQDFFTWYADFTGVKVISSSEMASISLGGNVVYRPGTRLVKITSDPNVYAVEPGGVLRWIQTEEVALALYGSDWNKRIDDIPDAFFFNYTIGDPLAAAVYPEGSIVKRTTDNALFLIENRTKRRITSDQVKTALRIQDKFVLTTGSSLADYPDGTEIASASASLTDTSQKTGFQAPAVPTFSVVQPATGYIPTNAEADLIELHISSAKEVNVSQLAIRIEATTGKPAADTTDEDKGGLVYGNNAQPNMRMLRWVDAQGNVPFGTPQEVLVDVTQDQAQTFYFFGSFNVPANSEKVLYFRVQTGSLLPTGEGYKAVFLVTGTAVRDTSGATAAFAPTADITGRTLTTLASALEIKSSSNPGLPTYIRGAKDAAIAGLTFKATTYAPNVIKALTFQGYVDEESKSGFLAGGDSDNGSETRVTDMVSQVSLYDDKSNKIAGPVDIDVNGKASFSGLSVAIAAGQSAILILRGDISPTVELENSPNRLTFDITTAATDVTVTDDKGAKVNVIGDLANGGPKAGAYATIKNHGKVKFSWSGSSSRALAGSEQLLGTLSVEAKEDSFQLKTVAFRQASGIAQSLADIRLAYPSGSGTVSTPSQLFQGTSMTFNNMDIVVEKDKTVALKLYGQIYGRNAGAVYDESLKVQFGNADALQFVSQTDGQIFSETNLGSSTTDFYVAANTASSVKVGFSDLTVAETSTEPSSIYHDAPVEILNFFIKADPAGPVRVRKLTFKVSPNDVGKSGASNDSLEMWARIDGDFADDDGVADLNQIYGTTKTLIGEDSQTRITYTVVHSGTKNTSPVASNYVSASGDYALIEYAFNEGSELNIGAGGSQEYHLSLDATYFPSDKDHTLKVDLLGGADLAWTDIPSGAYTPLSGSSTVSNQVTVKK